MNVNPPDKHIVDLFLELKQAVFDHFGYKEDWVAIPIEDGREYYWTLYENPDGSGHVRFADNIETLQDFEAGEFYEHPIYTQRFLPRWVYQSEDYTMISLDTQTDGNKFLYIFDNSKEIKDDKPYRSFYDVMGLGT